MAHAAQQHDHRRHSSRNGENSNAPQQGATPRNYRNGGPQLAPRDCGSTSASRSFNNTPTAAPAVQRYAKAFTAPHVALRDAPRVLALWSELRQCRNNTTGRAWIGDEELRRRLGCSQRTLERSRAELLRRVPAWFHVYRAHRGGGRLGPNEYYLPDSPEPQIFQPPTHQPPYMAVLFEEQDPKTAEEQGGMRAARSQDRNNEDGSTARAGAADASLGAPADKCQEAENEGSPRAAVPTPQPWRISPMAALVWRTFNALRKQDIPIDRVTLLAHCAADAARLKRDGCTVDLAPMVDRMLPLQYPLPIPPVMVSPPRSKTPSNHNPGRGPFKAKTRVRISLGTPPPAPPDIGRAFLAHLRQSIIDRSAFHAWFDPLFEPGGIVDRGAAVVLTVTRHAQTRILERHAPELAAAAAHVGRRIEWREF